MKTIEQNAYELGIKVGQATKTGNTTKADFYFSFYKKLLIGSETQVNKVMQSYQKGYKKGLKI